MLNLSFSVHLCVTYVHTHEGVAERFLGDVENGVTEIMKDPNSEIGGMVWLFALDFVCTFVYISWKSTRYIFGIIWPCKYMSSLKGL